ncbi:hypothetical protein QQ045_031263 [Rhodiola kirilowii]
MELEKKRKEESQLAYEKRKQLNKLKIKAEKVGVSLSRDCPKKEKIEEAKKAHKKMQSKQTLLMMSTLYSNNDDFGDESQ